MKTANDPYTKARSHFNEHDRPDSDHAYAIDFYTDNFSKLNEIKL